MNQEQVLAPKPMIYRRFGKTEQQVSVFSLGMMRSMHSWQDAPLAEIPAASTAKLELLIRKALELGINHLETARGYGSSERQLGQILAKIPRMDFLIQTKIRPSLDTEQFRADFHDSLERLQLKRVDFLSIHGINDFESLWQVCRTNGCLATARQLQSQGKVGHVGFSGHGASDVLLEAISCDQYDGFDYLNLHWYTIFQRHQAVLQEAAARDLGVFIISPSDKGGQLQKPPQKLLKLSQPFTPMQFNDLFCLEQPEIHTISLGAAQPADLEAHLEILPLIGSGDDQVNNVLAKWQGAMAEATGLARPDGEWDKFPPWDKTPGYINIQFVLWLYNLARGWDMVEFGRGRYQKLGLEMPWVPGNNGAHAKDYKLQEIAAKAGYQEQQLQDLLSAADSLLGEKG